MEKLMFFFFAKIDFFTTKKQKKGLIFVIKKIEINVPMPLREADYAF